MGVSSSLYSGVSGLNANANAMSVLGDNLANANTIGFKSSRTIFGDLLSSSVSGSGGTSQVGRGVGLSTVDTIFSQGTFENTETNTDLAVEGAGFFIVSDPSTGNASNNYTRSGAFRFDADGFLVNPEGYNVMGYQLDGDGSPVGDLTPIWTNTQSFTPAQPTSAIDLNTNLDSDSVTIGTVGTSATAIGTTLSSAGVATPNAAYASLAADPADTTLQTAAQTAATLDNTNFVAVNTAIATLRTEIAADPTSVASATAAAAVDTAIGTATGVAQTTYADALLADPTGASTLVLATTDEARSNSVIAAVATLQDSITTPPFDPLDPSGTSNTATSIQVFDSLGSTHLMTTYFTKTSDQNWVWNTVVNGSEVTGGTSGELEIVGSGSLAFDASGDLISVDGAQLYTIPGDTSSDPIYPRPQALTTAGDLDWVNGAIQTQQVAIDMQTSQYASPSIVVSQEQDGFGTGTLVKLSVDELGNVIGNFSNGTPRELMRIPLAKFTNPSALTKIGSNMYMQSTSSGVPVIGTVGSGVGNIFTNALELSNVDMAQEFVKMITTQRGFSANSKTITTTDEMLAEVIGLKR